MAMAEAPMPSRQDRLRRARDALGRLDARGGGNGQGDVLPLDGGGPIDRHVPDGGLSLGCLHEIVLADPRDGAGLGLAGWLLGQCARRSGGKPVLWVGESRCGPLVPQALAWLGVPDDRLVQVIPRAPADRLWALEEAARSPALAAVAGMLDRLDLTATRRLQLAAEAGGGACLLLRPSQGLTTSAAVTRWRPVAAPSRAVPLPGGMGVEPGVGMPVWDLALLRARGCPPAAWLVTPAGDRLQLLSPVAGTLGASASPRIGQGIAWPGRRAA